METPHGLGPVVDALVASYRADQRGRHVNRRFLPSPREIEETIGLLLQVFYPGYFRQGLTDEDLAFHVGAVVSDLAKKLVHQIEACLCHGEEGDEPRSSQDVGARAVDVGRCHQRGEDLARTFVARLPAIRHVLLTDVQAAFDGDPAAGSIDEIILAYPGLLAVTVHRVAHELFVLGVPLLPRMMSEWAHTKTGADIHPGAHIGPSFFIDHATGVVIGETSDIGARVRLYQGVTLGALSLPRGADGRVVRSVKRHPTVEDDVIVYANATVLGGQTVLGKGSVIGGSVFLTESVPPGSKVAIEAPRLKVAPPA